MTKSDDVCDRDIRGPFRMCGKQPQHLGMDGVICNREVDHSGSHQMHRFGNKCVAHWSD